MTDTTIPAAAQLQSWLDGNTDTLSKAAVRAVLWELAEAQTQLAQFGEVQTEWTVALHGQRSIQYGAYAMPESAARNDADEELRAGHQASVAHRTVGQWQHEDPEAQRHADAISAMVKAATR